MRTVADYLALPYRRIIELDVTGLWSGRVLEFDGVFSEGTTADEAAANLELAMRFWIEHELDRGRALPEPARDVGRTT